MGDKRIAMSMFCALSMMLGISGCATPQMSPKERSYSLAMQILGEPSKSEVARQIKHCEDVDALRIVAFSAWATAWPGEAGPDVEFDNKMDAITLMALDRLFAIDSKEADRSIEFFKRSFPPDGGYGVFFWEKERERASKAP